MPGLGSLTGGVLALGVNLAVYVALVYLVPRSVDELFKTGKSRLAPSLSLSHTH